MKHYDVIIIGGGTSGVAAGYIAAKNGLKTLIIEKNIHLGGLMTSGLVTPAMKTSDLGINTEFYNDLIEFTRKYGAQVTYCDGNPGWFNPELLKIALDDMMLSVDCDIVYNANVSNVSVQKNGNFKIKLETDILSIYYDTEYIVDATGMGKIAKRLNCDFIDNKIDVQAATIRFSMSGIDLETFRNWIIELDKDRNVTTSCNIDNQVHLSTAYTWDINKNWALRPIFEKAVHNKDLNEEDTAYFQVFTIPGMPTSIVFNCPRILIKNQDEMNNPQIFSKILAKSRLQIFRFANFCKKYFKGFEKAYISNIADIIGIREQGRVVGQYVYTPDDIVRKRHFKNIALSSDYPIDIHSSTKSDDRLQFTDGNYYLPVESLISKKYDNLFVIGKAVSATFEAQAALRVQPSCFSMGEAVAKYIKNKLS